MPHDPHGNVPDASRVALLLVDVINDLEFDEGAELFVQALPMARRLAELKRRTARFGIPAIYLNDNFGRWRSDFRATLKHVLRPRYRGAPIAKLLKPTRNDYFVLKPRSSGFYSTCLDVLLDHLGARTLIVTGLTADMCVLATASDAHMRDFNVVVPADCVATRTLEDCARSLEHMRRSLHADITDSSELDLEKLARRTRPRPQQQ